MYRWHVPNPVRFQESLKVEIQDIGEFGPGSDDLTSVAFWYQEEPHRPFALQPFAERAAQSKAQREQDSSRGEIDATAARFSAESRGVRSGETFVA